jgi:hypothetical protein
MRGLVPRIHAGPFRRLTRNGKVIDIARHFLAKSLAVPLGVDGRDKHGHDGQSQSLSRAKEVLP